VYVPPAIAYCAVSLEGVAITSNAKYKADCWKATTDQFTDVPEAAGAMNPLTDDRLGIATEFVPRNPLVA
jgi:hypothetical protein